MSYSNDDGERGNHGNVDEVHDVHGEICRLASEIASKIETLRR